MGLINVIKAVGEEGIKVQYLANCMKGITTNKKGISTISFSTDVVTTDNVMRGNGYVAMILWIPRDKAEAQVREQQAKETDRDKRAIGKNQR